MSDETGARSGVPPILVLRKIKQVLECFTIEQPELSLPQLTRATGLPPSTCQRLVHNLVREGFLDRDGDRYRIGLGLVRWAAPGSAGPDLVRLIQPVLSDLRDETGETVRLHVRDGGFRTVVALAEARHPVIRLCPVGTTTVLHAGSAGKVFMAFDPAARRAAVARGLARLTARTTVDIDVLDAQLGEVRERGFAASFEERETGAASISAPVLGRSGELVAVLGIGAPVQRLGRGDVARLAPAVRAAADRASQRLGGHPPAAENTASRATRQPAPD